MRLRRRYDKLTYEVPMPLGAHALMRALSNMGAQFAFGSASVEDWTARCEASRRASRRRRGF